MTSPDAVERPAVAVFIIGFKKGSKVVNTKTSK
jgi:hypothetical protein